MHLNYSVTFDINGLIFPPDVKHYSLCPFISVVIAFEEVQHKTCECGQRDGPDAHQKV